MHSRSWTDDFERMPALRWHERGVYHGGVGYHSRAGNRTRMQGMRSGGHWTHHNRGVMRNHARQQARLSHMRQAQQAGLAEFHPLGASRERP